MDIKDRLSEFVKYLGYSDARFEREAELSNGFLKKTNANMRKTSIESILAHFPQLSRDWLINGNGEMIRQVPQSGNHFIGNNNQGIDNSYNKRENSDSLIQLLSEQSKIISKSQEQLSKSQEQLSVALEQISKLTSMLAKGGKA